MAEKKYDANENVFEPSTSAAIVSTEVEKWLKRLFQETRDDVAEEDVHLRPSEDVIGRTDKLFMRIFKKSLSHNEGTDWGLLNLQGQGDPTGLIRLLKEFEVLIWCVAKSEGIAIEQEDDTSAGAGPCTTQGLSSNQLDIMWQADECKLPVWTPLDEYHRRWCIRHSKGVPV